MTKPLISMDYIKEIIPGFWVIRDSDRIPLVPNIAIIEGDRSVLVVDTGMGPKNARQVLNKAKEISGDRQIFLTITHFHPEHGFGAQEFINKAAIIYNRRQREELHDKGNSYVELFRTFGPEVKESLEGIQLVDPDFVYDGTGSFDLGGRVVDLMEVGSAHTRGDQLIWLPKERIIIAGDLIETRVFPIFPYFPPHDVDVNGNHWIKTLKQMLSMEPEIVIPGHCEIGGAELIKIAIGYLERLGSRVEERKNQGQDVQTIVDELGPIVRGEHPDWREPNWVESGIRSFFSTGYLVEA